MPNPWMDSDDLISSIKRKISFPTSQNTFTDEDILAFANEELMISQVPSILQFHEEYFVTKEVQVLNSYQSAYPIPTRAIGMKLRGVFWCDNADGPDIDPDTGLGGNLFEMSRVNSEDKAFFQANLGANRAVHKYYIEGNNVILTPTPTDAPQGSLVLYYFLRPNQLTTTDESSTISSFSKTITITNASLAAGDTITVTVDGEETVFTAVSGSASTDEFQIGATSTITATNLVTSITTNGVVSASSLAGVVTLAYSDRTITIESSNSTGLAVSALLGCVCDQVPTDFAVGSVIDFLQTKPGHQTLGMSVTIPTSGISGTTLKFTDSDVPNNILVGDYICLENQCIIPQIPPDLHNGLAERTGARILAALGDMQGLQASDQKIAEIDKSQGMLLDNRTEGEPRKILARHSLLRYGKMGTTRRL